MDTFNLHAFVEKLNHPVVEVRERALLNIYNKYSRAFLTVDVLLTENNLCTYLLEWFNQDYVSHQSLVLHLLHAIAEHPAGCRHLQKLGALSFLTQLRQDCGKEIQHSIDNVVNVLLREDTTNRTANTRRNLELLRDVKYNEEDEENLQFLKVNYTHKNGRDIVPPAEGSGEPSGPIIGYFDDSRSMAVDSISGVLARPARDAAFMPHVWEEAMDFGENDAFKILHFPTVALIRNDRQCLENALLSLSSTEARVVIGALEFIQGVIFHDFPPEVFLQRPGITKSMFTILLSGELALVRPVCQCLLQLVLRLQERIRTSLDPNLYSRKDILKSLNASSGSGSVNDSWPLHSGGGQSLNRSAPVAGPVHQSVPYFCLEVLSVSLGQFIAYQSKATYPVVFALMSAAVDLLNMCQPTSRKACLRTREMVGKFTEVMEKWQRMLARHSQHEVSTVPVSTLPRYVWMGLGAPLLTFLDTILEPEYALNYVSEALLQELVHLSADATYSLAFPQISQIALSYVRIFHGDSFTVHRLLETLSGAMHALLAFRAPAQDAESMSIEYRLSLATKAFPLLDFVADGDFVENVVRLYADSVAIKDTVRSGVVLPQTSQSKAGLDEQMLLLQLLAHRNPSVARSAYASCHSLVKSCLSIQAAVDPQSLEYRRVFFLLQRPVLREFVEFGLNCDQEEIRELCSATLVHLWESRLCMGPDAWRKLLLVSGDLLPLYQMHASCQPGNALARFLLQISLLPSAIVSKMPTWSAVGGQSHNVPDPSVSMAMFESVEYLMLNAIRLSWHKEESVRREAIACLLRLLQSEEDCEKKLPALRDEEQRRSDRENLEWNQRQWQNWIFLSTPEEQPVSLIGRVTASNSNSARKQSDSLRKVLDIFMNESLDTQVRRTAAEQVLIFLQNEDMVVEVVNHSHAVSYCMSLLHRCVWRENLLLHGLIQSCVGILRIVALSSAHLRKSMARDTALLFTLVRCGLYMAYEKALKADISALLCMLAFSDFAARDASTQFALPQCVRAGLQIPVQCVCYNATSPHTLPHTDAQGLFNASPSAQRALRIRWAVAQCLMGEEEANGDAQFLQDNSALPTSNGGQLALATRFHTLPEPKEGCFGRLRLTELDRHLVEVTLPGVVVPRLLAELRNAASHQAVRESLTSLLLVMHVMPREELWPMLVRCTWYGALERYLRLQPSCSADYQLLDLLLQTLDTFMNLLLHQVINRELPRQARRHEYISQQRAWQFMGAFCQWLVPLLSQQFNPVVVIFERGDALLGNTDSARLVAAKEAVQKRVLEFLLMIMRVCHQDWSSEWTLFTSSDGDAAHGEEAWLPLIARILRRCDAIMAANAQTPFNNLLLLASTTSIMTLCMLVFPWPPEEDGDTERISFTNQATPGLLERTVEHHLSLLHSLQMMREALSVSFMGTALLRSLLVALARALRFHSEMRRLDQWEDLWLLRNWMLPFLSYRAVEVRAVALCIASIFCAHEGTCARICAQARRRHSTGGDTSNDPGGEEEDGGLWTIAFHLLCDPDEAPLVRTYAAHLLTALTKQSFPPSGRGLVRIPLNCTLPIVRAPDPEAGGLMSLCVGLEALQRVMELFNLLRSFGISLSNLYLYPHIYAETAALHHNSSLQADVSNTSVPHLVKHMLNSETPTGFSPTAPDTFGTPLLCAAMCGLVQNLCHHLPVQLVDQLRQLKLNTLLMNVIDSDILEVYLQGEDDQMAHPVAQHLLDLCAESLRIVRILCALDTESRAFMLCDERFVVKLVRLFALPVGGPHDTQMYALWREVFLLLLALLVPDPGLTSALLLLRVVAARLATFLHLLTGLMEVVRVQRSVGISTARSSARSGGSTARRTTREPLLSSNYSIASTALRHGLHLFSILATRGLQLRSAVQGGPEDNGGPSSIGFLTPSILQERLALNPVFSLLAVAVRDSAASEEPEESDLGSAVDDTCTEPVSSKGDEVSHQIENFVESALVLKDTLDTRGLVAPGGSSARSDRQTNASTSTEQSSHSLRVALHNALKVLLATSFVAKERAIHLGFLEGLLSRTKVTLSKTSLLSSDIPTGSSARDSPFNQHLNQIAMDLELIQNLIFSHSMAKSVAATSSLLLVLQRLWPLALLRHSTASDNVGNMSCFVSLLCVLMNLCAFCHKASSAMCQVASTAQFLVDEPNCGADVAWLSLPGTPLASPSNASLLHFTTQLLLASECVPGSQQLPLSNSPRPSQSKIDLLRLAFALLGNIVLSPQARGALGKLKFVENFSYLPVKQLRKSKAGLRLISHWLHFLVNLSFSEEGQRLVMRIPDVLQVIIFLADHLPQQPTLQFLALLLLRNLSTNEQLKARLLFESKVVSCLCNHLDLEPSTHCRVTLSALKSLLFNNQKARSVMKGETFMKKIMSLWEEAKEHGSTEVISEVHDLVMTLQA